MECRARGARANENTKQAERERENECIAARWVTGERAKKERAREYASVWMDGFAAFRTATTSIPVQWVRSFRRERTFFARGFFRCVRSRDWFESFRASESARSDEEKRSCVTLSGRFFRGWYFGFFVCSRKNRAIDSFNSRESSSDERRSSVCVFA